MSRPRAKPQKPFHKATKPEPTTYIDARWPSRTWVTRTGPYPRNDPPAQYITPTPGGTDPNPTTKVDHEDTKETK